MFNKFLGLLATIVLALGLTACSNETDKKPNKVIKPGITLSNYSKLEEGMSYEQVKKILGTDGELLFEKGNKNNENNTSYQAAYKWIKENEGIVIVKFANDKLRSTQQSGLN